MSKFDRQTGPDALALHLTGASSDGGTQTDPDESLGGFRSSTRLGDMGFIVRDPMPQVRVIEAYGQPGVGSLEAEDADTLRYTPAGGGQGQSVSISDGETKIVPGEIGDGGGDYVVVERTTGDALSGTMSIELIDTLNQILTNLTTDQHADGGPRYRAVMIRARKRLENLKLWLGSADDVSIGIEAPKANGSIQTIPAGDVAPGGVSFSQPTTEGGALTIASMDAGTNYGLWLKAGWTADGSTAAAATFDIQIKHDAPLT